jgi:hypothetical protein
MATLSGFPSAEIQYDKAGNVSGTDQDVVTLAADPTLTDLIILTHGWNDDTAAARQLFANLAASLRAVIDAGHVPQLAGRSLGIVGLIWPAKDFADVALVAGPGATRSRVTERDVINQIDRLRPVFPGDNSRKALDEAVVLVPELAHHASARAAFVDQLRPLVTPIDHDPAEGPAEFFTESGTVLMQRLSDPVLSGPHRSSTAVNGEEVAGPHPRGGSLVAAQNLLNYITFYEMKARSGIIGQQGLAPTIKKVKTIKPALRIHLVGHSFGARLVSAATRVAIPAGPTGPVATLTLLQAAFSHYGFSDDWDLNHPGAQPGYFRADITTNKITGPILITYTANDLILGYAYALATLLGPAFEPSVVGDANNTYGALGHNGTQRTPEAVNAVLQAVGGPYHWRPGKPHNLLADTYIADHSDVTGQEVGYALLSAIAAT